MAKTARFNIPLNAVVYREGDWWIAHCLELDLVAEGKTPREAIKDLMDLSATQINLAIDSGDLESIFRPAPAEVWRMFWMAGKPSPLPKKPALPIERFEARELVLA